MGKRMEDRVADGVRYRRLFDLVGDMTGSYEMNVNGSVTPVDFKITVPDNETYFIFTLSGKIEDTGSFDSNTFGAIPKLANGLDLYQQHVDLTEVKWTEQHNIKDNTDWGVWTTDVTLWGGDLFPAAGALLWNYHFMNDGQPAILKSGQSLIWRISDDLSGISSMHLSCGYTKIFNSYL